MKCSSCGRELTGDETGMSRKLLGRATRLFLCYQCISARFSISPEKLGEMADQFREAGCTLFPGAKRD